MLTLESAMPPLALCRQCLEAGLENPVATTGDSLVACPVCGTVDERATYRHNAVEVSAAFGTLLDDAALAGARFKELQEKQHEVSQYGRTVFTGQQFVDQLLEAYLVDPQSRIVTQPASHFKAGARAWYNRMRTEEEYAYHRKRATTSNSAQKVPYRVALAILFTIQDSNITVVNNRLAHLKKDGSSAGSTFHGDGSIMAPSLGVLFVRRTHVWSHLIIQARTHALQPTHIGHLKSSRHLRILHKRYGRAFNRNPTPVDLILSQVYAMAHHVKRLCDTPWEVRLGRLSNTELKAGAKRRGVTMKTATVDDLLLDSAAWEYMSNVDWQAVLETAYQLYCATQVVNLWGSSHSPDYASALLFWSIQAVKQDNIPSVSAWSAEMAQAYGGNDANALARRAELKDLLVAWSTSFQEAQIPVPLTVKPRRGRVGDGLTGWGSDRRRPMPESVMAMAAAPVVARYWRQITLTRLRCRSSAWPLDTEYAMAAKMFAAAHHAHGSKQWKRRSVKRQTAADLTRSSAVAKSSSPATHSQGSTVVPSRSTSANPTRASSVSASASSRLSPAPSVGSPCSSHSTKSRQDMLRLMNIGVPSRPTSPPPQPTIEELLSRRDDSSDDGDDHPSDDESIDEGASSTGRLGVHDKVADIGSPFAFSIGPQGFTVASQEETVAPATVITLKRQNEAPGSGGSPKRRRLSAVPPISPPATAFFQSSPSTSPSLNTISAPNASTAASPASPRMMTLSPSPSHTSLPLPTHRDEDDVSRYAGLLVREREQYITYNSYNERLRGIAVSVEIEAAMNSWVQTARDRGIIPPVITPAYLASLGLHGDPRKLDLSSYIEVHSGQWSPVESLLRAGLRPLEFPPHYVVHSLVDLEFQLNRDTFTAKLAAEGVAVSETDLDAELDVLFAQGGEDWKDLISTPEEATAKEKLYLKQGVWSHDRFVPEGPRNALSNKATLPTASLAPVGGVFDHTTLDFRPQGSRRINYEALDRLLTRQDASDFNEKSDEDDDDPAVTAILQRAHFTGLDMEGERSPGDPGYATAAEETNEDEDDTGSELEW